MGKRDWTFRSLIAGGICGAFLAAPGVTAAEQPHPAGPCTEAAARGMPNGEEHDHDEIDQHRLACRIRQVAFDSLRDELRARPDVILGEMDARGDLVAVGITFPESGFLLYDVADPGRPRFLSWYRSSECESLAIDVNCGAFVDLSDDGELVFLASQNLSLLPGGVPRGTRPFPVPGVEVVDVSDPRHPALRQLYPVLSEGGTHTARSHVIPPGPDNGPRRPGEYVFAIANGFGVEIARVNPRGGLLNTLTPVSRIAIDGAHDTFIHNDPLDRRTYLYVAAEFASGFYVYDVTDPSEADLVAEWDLTPECEDDWYAHTIDVKINDGRRYVTMPAELFDLGEQSEEDQGQGCGEVTGNGDREGPLWIVDATDLDALRPPDGTDENGERLIRRRSRAALVATWTNPALRDGGNLIFSPHNQQVVGSRIYLSHYHGGVYVLDASAAFRGRHVRPRELGFIVPHGPETRPFNELGLLPLLIGFSDTEPTRPMIWDMVFHRGHILAADMSGGFYSLQYAGDS